MHKIVIQNHRVTVDGIAQTLDISCGAVYTVLRVNLEVRKMNAKWVLHAMTMEQWKLSRVMFAMRNLTKMRKNPQELWRRFVKVETWMYRFKPGKATEYQRLDSL